DINAQRFASTNQPLPAPDAPFVTVLSSNALSVTWPVLQGYSVAGYQVFADGAAAPTATVTDNWWTMSGLAAGSTHYFQLKYVLADGRQSPLSAATTNATFSALWYYGVIPQEWMTAYWGSAFWTWPSPNADSDGDGVSNLNEWLAGTNPTNAASVLRVRLRTTAQGLFLDWNTEAGLLYQVQAAANFGQWTNVGGPRFAAGGTDSAPVGGGGAGFYRILRIR
ncbi:MAG: fibronectin type III domain-containing protein, partial [Verrucomicrobia bacterium]|nr:fibronectin type III domain-containing protein [Verrucomicrobiota bacterium]